MGQDCAQDALQGPLGWHEWQVSQRPLRAFLAVFSGLLLKSLGIPTPRNPHYQALGIPLIWPTPLSYPVTKYLASQEYNRDIPLTTTIQE